MELLSKLSLPQLDDKTFNEINYLMALYDEVSSITDKRINIDARKKNILLSTFDIFSGMFDLDFEQKLKFGKSETHDIYLDNIDNKSYQELFYELFYKCCYKYLEKSYTLKGNKIDEKIYTLSRLAILNDDVEVIDYLINSAYEDLLENNEWLKKDNILKISLDKNKIKALMQVNKDRNYKLKESVMQYLPYEDLSYSSACNIFKCLSNDIYQDLSKDEKVYLMNLLYNYFSMEDKVSMSSKYKKIINNKTTRNECITKVIQDLQISGKTMIIMKKNRDRIKDFLSWLPLVYSNETRKENINSLDSLYTLIGTNTR